jgi:glutathione S-transferase
VLNNAPRGKAWLIGEQRTIADFSIGALVPSAECMGHKGLAALPAWRKALAIKEAATAAWQSQDSQLA